LASFPSLKALDIPDVAFRVASGRENVFTPHSFLEALSSAAPILEELFMNYGAGVSSDEHVRITILFFLGSMELKR
jgi:hypothetical protein